MGGKTVALKMVGLFVAMAVCGMHVPAARHDDRPLQAHLRRYRRRAVDRANTSTFSAHLRRMREMLAGADARSLMLIDEIGGGTEPNAGAALAVALLERFLECGARRARDDARDRTETLRARRAARRNASVRFDPHTFAPTYQLDLGSPGQSLAFPLARAMHRRLRS